MSDFIKKIAKVLTEDPDIFSNYQEKFRSNTVLDEEIYGEIVGILKDVAQKNGLQLDHRRIKVKFNPAGLTIKNIRLECPDSRTKRELAMRVAEITGDDNIKHTFNKNLRVNLYNAINKEFADRVREELNLEVTHQSLDPENAKDPSEIMPMATFTQPAVTAEKPEEEMDLAGPTGAEPEGGPEVPEEPGAEMGVPGPSMGGMPLGGDLGGDLEAPEELQNPEEGEEGEVDEKDIEMGPFGIEEPESEGEKAPPPEEGEEEDMISFENIQRVADLLTDDPDLFNV